MQKPRITVQLVHLQGPRKGEIEEFHDPIISIGRNPSCRLLFPKDLTIVSRQHADIIREGNRFKLVDHSTNGTFVNGKQVKEAFLKDGDVLLFAESGPKVSFLTRVQAEPFVPPEAPPAQPPPGVTSAAPGRSAQQDVHPGAEPPVTPAGAFQPVEPARRQTPPTPPPAAPPKGIPIQRAQIPLTILYGPTLRTFEELPITLGSGERCDFPLAFPGILDQHVQIFFAADQYWIKDLTGRGVVTVNGQPAGLQAALEPQSILSLTPQGPSFRFLGGGRLVQIESAQSEESPGQPPVQEPAQSVEPCASPPPEAKPGKRPGSILKKFWSH